MILSTSRIKLTKSRLELPDWVRAPLTLNNGATAYVTVDPGAPAQNSEFIEILCSPFDPQHWSDLWRIELETEDRIGILAALFKVLARNNIAVLASEGTVNTNGLLHEMSFVVSCKNYSSSRDGTTDDRAAKQDVQLVELFDEISLALIEFLNFRADGKARLKVRRLTNYFMLNHRFENKLITRPSRSTIQKSGFALSPSLAAEIRRLLSCGPNDAIWYSPSVDTKDRILRILLFSQTKRPLSHLQILCPNSTRLLNSIFELLAGHVKGKEDAKINIIRHQLRAGLNEQVDNKDTTPAEPMRLDITFVPAREWHSRDAMIGIIVDRIKSLPDFIVQGGQVLKTTGVPSNGTRRIQETTAPKGQTVAATGSRRSR